jgi:exopolyphosphatase / guanosine-5'-triphosphate,3'-diphosphate pyrophosphatase
MRRVASCDIGSNTVLLLVVDEVSPGRWARVEDHMAITRVSEGLAASGFLADAAVERTRAALAEFAAHAKRLGVQAMVATGTAPFRRGKNGSEVAASLGQTLGCTIDVVSGDTEADLVLLATVRSFPDVEAMTIVDIGGASTEIIIVRPGIPPRRTSVNVGTVSLGERFSTERVVDASQQLAIRNAIDAAFDDGPARELLLDAPPSAVAVSGTATTLAAMDLRMVDWDDEKVHGFTMQAARVAELAAEVCAVDVHGRVGIPGLPEKRADVIPAGALLLQRIAERVGAESIIVSDRGVRWGRLFDVFGGAGA